MGWRGRKQLNSLLKKPIAARRREDVGHAAAGQITDIPVALRPKDIQNFGHRRGLRGRHDPQLKQPLQKNPAAEAAAGLEAKQIATESKRVLRVARRRAPQRVGLGMHSNGGCPFAPTARLTQQVFAAPHHCSTCLFASATQWVILKVLRKATLGPAPHPERSGSVPRPPAQAGVPKT